eukprot:4253384-Alexandrium_andersonii.AAC.1
MAAKASSANGAERATMAASSAYSMSKKGTTGVRIRSRRERRRASASDMRAERMTTNRKGDKVHPCLMPPLCARVPDEAPPAETEKREAPVSSETAVIYGSGTAKRRRTTGRARTETLPKAFAQSKRTMWSD